MKQIRSNFQQSSKSDLLRRVMSYRGGYTPQDRRRIEKQMFSGELLAVIATNALELGVDIGSLGNAFIIHLIFGYRIYQIFHIRCCSNAWHTLVYICYGNMSIYTDLMHAYLTNLYSGQWQQSGRAGRRNNDSLALLIAAENPMDQHFMVRFNYCTTSVLNLLIPSLSYTETARRTV